MTTPSPVSEVCNVYVYESTAVPTVIKHYSVCMLSMCLLATNRCTLQWEWTRMLVWVDRCTVLVHCTCIQCHIITTIVACVSSIVIHLPCLLLSHTGWHCDIATAGSHHATVHRHTADRSAVRTRGLPHTRHQYTLTGRCTSYAVTSHENTRCDTYELHFICTVLVHTITCTVSLNGSSHWIPCLSIGVSAGVSNEMCFTWFLQHWGGIHLLAAGAYWQRNHNTFIRHSKRKYMYNTSYVHVCLQTVHVTSRFVDPSSIPSHYQILKDYLSTVVLHFFTESNCVIRLHNTMHPILNHHLGVSISIHTRHG